MSPSDVAAEALALLKMQLADGDAHVARMAAGEILSYHAKLVASQPQAQSEG